jgi:hypothetical protein
MDGWNINLFATLLQLSFNSTKLICDFAFIHMTYVNINYNDIKLHVKLMRING